MTSKRVSICIGADLARLLDGLPNSDTVSGRINRTTERYLAILAECRSPLSVKQYRLLREVLNGHRLPAHQIADLPGLVVDSPVGMTESGRALAGALAACSYAELAAVLELIGA